MHINDDAQILYRCMRGQATIHHLRMSTALPGWVDQKKLRYVTIELELVSLHPGCLLIHAVRQPTVHFTLVKMLKVQLELGVKVRIIRVELRVDSMTHWYVIDRTRISREKSQTENWALRYSHCHTGRFPQHHSHSLTDSRPLKYDLNQSNALPNTQQPSAWASEWELHGLRCQKQHSNPEKAVESPSLRQQT
jgi:hypothetical protein